MPEEKLLQPIAPSERLASLDVLRGFAVLGILLVNIQDFSMVFAAYLNPTAYGDLTGLNRWAWMLTHVLGDQKFMTIFSLLFGAGILLVTSKAESKGLPPAGLHYRRIFWLFVIGMMHAYLLWRGDILVAYAVCAVWVYLFRKKKPKTLLIAGAAFILVPALIYLLFSWSVPYWPPEAVESNIQMWAPPAERIAHEVAVYRGGWLQQMGLRVPSAIAFQTFIFLIYIGWRVTGVMLIGMALFKWRVLSAERSGRFYGIMLAAGFGIGIPLIVTGVVRNFAAGWAWPYSMFVGWQFNYLGSLGMAAGYIALVMLLCRSARLPALRERLAAVGRMAFTNYLLQSLICTTLFYGHGFGLFGKVQRWQQVLITVAIWTILLVISPLWLRRFRFGPVEWLWRTLTYRKSQPLRISRPTQVVPGV